MEINKINGTYSCGDLIVAPRLPVVWLQLAWEIMLRQDLLDILFYEGKVERDWFLKTYSAPEMTTYGCFVKTGLDPDALQLAGFGRVMPYPMGNNLWKAEIAVMFFKEYQSRKYTLPFCRMMIEHVFDNLVFRAIFGTTPLQNRAMLRFIKALGFGGTEVPCFTTWNGEPCGIYLSWMLKEDWKALREKA